MTAPDLNSSTRLDWQWSSVKGQARAENRDAAGLMSHPKYTMAVIVDASSRGHRGSAFNEAWIRSILAGLNECIPTPTELMRIMQTAQKKLRGLGFREERACYAAIVAPHRGGGAYGLFCGDCRIGFRDLYDATIWVSRPHTAATLCENEPNTPSLAHIVTRNLKVQRFVEPECVYLDSTNVSSWILATDGHYRDQAAVDNADDDDRSFILLGRSVGVTVSSDADNFYLPAPEGAITLRHLDS